MLKPNRVAHLTYTRATITIKKVTKNKISQTVGLKIPNGKYSVIAKAAVPTSGREIIVVENG